jgi:hypothetical protein
VTTTLAKTQTISKQRLTNTNEYTIEFAEKYFPNLVLKDSVTDDFERPAHTWSYNGSEFGVYYLDDTTLEYTARVTYSKLYTDLGTTVAAKNIELYVDGKAVDVTDSVARSNTNQVGSSGNGVLTEVYETIANDGTVSLRIVQVNTFVGTVAYATRATSTTDRTITLSTYTTSLPDGTLNPKFATEEFAAQDLVSYTAAWNSATNEYDIVTVAALEVADTGLLTQWNGTKLKSDKTGESNSNFTVNDTKYQYSQNYAVVDGTGAEGAVWSYTVNKSNLNVYLDNYGYALFVNGVNVEKNYAVIIGVGTTNAYGSTTTGVTLLLPDGTQVEASAVLSGTQVWGTDTTGSNEVKEKIGDLVTYTVNDKGVYTLTVVGKWDGTGHDAANQIEFTNGKSAFTLTADGGSETYLYTTSETVFFVATGTSGTKLTYNVYTGYAAMPSVISSQTGMGLAYVTNSRYSNQIDYVYLYADHLAGVTGVNTYFVKAKNATITTDSTGSYYTLPAIVNGQETTVKVKSSLLSDNSVANLYAITNVIKDTNDIITYYDSGMSAFNATSSSYVTGTVAARNGVLGIGSNGAVATADYYAYNDSTAVYVVDKDYKTISISAVSAVTNDTNDLVYASYDSSSRLLKDVVIVTKETTTTTPTPVTNNGQYSSVVNTAAKASTLGLVDFSDTTTFNIDGAYTIDKFNKVDGESLSTQIKDFLTYKGYTDIGALSHSGASYSITATDPDGIVATLTMADSVITSQIKKVTIDGTVYYADSSATVTSLLGAGYTAAKNGTYAKGSDGDYAEVGTAADLTSGVSYTTGYYKVSMNGTSVTGSPSNITISSCTAVLKDKDSNGDVYVNADGDVTVTITVAASGAVSANTLNYAVANSAGATEIVVAPANATALTHDALANSDTVDIDVTVTLSGIAAATTDAVLQITLS